MILITGSLFGVLSGLLVSLTFSPVTGVTLTAFLGVFAAASMVGAETPSMLRLRWIYFTRFALSFMLGFAMSASAGLGLRSFYPTPAELLVETLQELGLPDERIGELVAPASQDSGNSAAYFGADWLFYSTFHHGGAAMVPNAGVRAANGSNRSPEHCYSLRPPPNGYTDIAILNRFDASGSEFAKITKVVRDVADPDADPILILKLLHVGYYGVCRA
ncbi:MAG: hypothetical protein AAFY56_13225 [Pseudomonadota bacterium]